MKESKCCGAEMLVETDRREGTSYHVCRSCSNPCDADYFEPLRHGNERCEVCAGQHEEGAYCQSCALAAEIARSDAANPRAPLRELMATKYNLTLTEWELAEIVRVVAEMGLKPRLARSPNEKGQR